MVTVIVRYRVKDYAKWRPYYDGYDEQLKAAGRHSGAVYQGANDPNEILLLFQWDSEENARRFNASPELKARREKAGVISTPEMYVVGEMEHIAR